MSGEIHQKVNFFIDLPTYGCYVDKRMISLKNQEKSIDKIWSIGGRNGWYFATWMWKLRDFIDKIFGGVGLRRGRTHPYNLSAGDAIDFLRVLYAYKQEGRLLLFAEMKLPGEAWLEFKVANNMLYQTATFRPKGLLGRLYWYAVLPFHGFIFKGMINKLN